MASFIHIFLSQNSFTPSWRVRIRYRNGIPKSLRYSLLNLYSMGMEIRCLAKCSLFRIFCNSFKDNKISLYGFQPNCKKLHLFYSSFLLSGRRLLFPQIDLTIIRYKNAQISIFNVFAMYVFEWIYDKTFFKFYGNHYFFNANVFFLKDFRGKIAKMYLKYMDFLDSSPHKFLYKTDKCNIISTYVCLCFI